MNSLGEGELPDSTGVSFAQALLKKFEQCDIDNGGEKPISVGFSIHVPKSAIEKSKCGELVVPSLLTLNFCNVAFAGPMSDIACTLADVRELDLASNSISQWQEVFAIIAHLPKLSLLNLSKNPLNESQPITVDQMTTVGCYGNIHELVLNSSRIPWSDVVQLLTAMPELTELHLSLNEYSTVDLPVDLNFPSLTSLFFNSNLISAWSEVCKLGRAFPNLSTLVMTGNPVESISDESTAADEQPEMESCNFPFPLLKSLNVSETRLNSWKELEVLSRFPCLTDVRLQGIKFFESTEEKLRRMLMIGFLPKLGRLNGSRITEDERETANRAFVRHFANHENPPARFSELVKIIGHLDPLVDISLAPPTSVLVTVRFQDKVCTKRFRLDATASVVKQSLARDFVRLPLSAFHLYYNDVDAPYGHEHMKFPERTLLSYRVKDGDEIIVDLKSCSVKR